MNAADVIPALEQVAGVLANSATTSGEFSAAAELSRAAVSALDDALAGHQASKAEIFSAIAPPVAAPGKYQLRARSIVETVEAVLAHGRAGETLSARREIAVWLAAQLDVRAREAEKAEEARNKARSPFQSQTRRAQELAVAFATYPALATRVGELFVTDIDVRRRAKSAYSRVPRGPSRAVGYGEAFEPPRTIAKPEILQKTILPRIHKGNRTDSYFPGPYGDIKFIEKQHIEFGPDAGIVGELVELSRGAPTAEAVDGAVAKADARLIAEFAVAIVKTDKLKALDAAITAAELGACYPDGGKIFADELFPQWVPRMMARWIALPDLGRYQIAAE
jgi:hypothetical protein